MDEKNVLYILVGCSGSGKSTWAKNQKGNFIILESDKFRKQIFGDLTHQSKQDHSKVFSHMNKQLQKELDKNKQDIIYDATNLSRKKRSALYQLAKARDYDVCNIIFLRPFKSLLLSQADRPESKQVSEEVLKRQYKSFNPPRIGVDCDFYYIQDINFYEYGLFELEYISYNSDIPHYSPYHQETITEHIRMTEENAMKAGCNLQESLCLNVVASYHDLGKMFCREEDKSDSKHVNWYRDNCGPLYRYPQHENVSCIYYMVNSLSSSQTAIKYNDMKLEAIYQHMRAHQGFSEKYIKKNKLTEKDLTFINKFATIDKESKVVDEDILRTYKEMMKGD